MGIGNELEKIPPGVLAAAVVGVALLALSQNKGGAANGGYGLVRAYEPTPMDPGIVQIQLAQIGAQSQAVSDALSVTGAEDIARVNAGQSLGLANIGASRDAYLGRIEGDVSLARTSAAREVSLADIQSTFQLGMREAENTASLGLASIASGERIAFGGYRVQDNQTASGERIATQQIGVTQQLGSQSLTNDAASNAAAAATSQYNAATQRKATPGTKERIFNKIIGPAERLIKWLF